VLQWFLSQKCQVTGSTDGINSEEVMLQRCDEFSFWDDEARLGRLKPDYFAAMQDRDEMLNWISDILSHTDKVSLILSCTLVFAEVLVGCC
jgi:hypothetical protein